MALGEARPPVFVAVGSVNNVYAERTNINRRMIQGELIDGYDAYKLTEELNVIQQVRKLLRGQWLNGLIVTSVRRSDQIYGFEQSGVGGQTRNSRRRHGFHHEWQMAGGEAVGKPIQFGGCEVLMSDHPIDLLGETGFREMDPHIPIMEGDFTSEQVDKMIDYLRKTGYLNFDNVLQDQHRNTATGNNTTAKHQEQIQKEFRMLVDRNPEQLLKIAAFY